MTMMLNPVPSRFDLLDIPIDPLTLDQAIRWVRARACEEGPMLLVHTVNVDHVVTARRDEEFLRVSREAALSVADGMPLVWGARGLGHPVPERVTGVDLFEGLARMEGPAIPTFLFGAMPEVAARAADALAMHPGVHVVGHMSPGPQELAHEGYMREAIETINQSGAKILAVALGAPKQELWLAKYAAELRVRIGIGIGATLDFMAGARRRAPRWMQRLGLEWLFRTLSEPIRLGKRYLVRDPIFAAWMAREFLRCRFGRKNTDSPVRGFERGGP